MQDVATLSESVLLVKRAAVHLKVSEETVFRLAFKRAFPDRHPQRYVEFYETYKLTGVVPTFVQKFCNRSMRGVPA